MTVPALIEDDAGFTLVELLTTIVVGMVVLFAALQLMDFGFTSTSRVQDRADASGRARLALDRATLLLQAQVCNGTTSPVTSATPTSVTFTANTGDLGSPVKTYRLWYDAVGQRLMETTGGADSVIVDRAVPETSGAPVFRYYGTDDPLTNDPVPLDLNGTVVEGISDPDPATQTKKLARVLSVTVALRVLPTRNGAEERTSTLLRTTAYVTSNLDPAKLDKGPQCL